MSGGHHPRTRITEGYRCPVQPIGDRCLDKHLDVNGSSMTYRDAMLHGFLRYEIAADLSERSLAVWTEKAAQHNSRRF